MKLRRILLLGIACAAALAAWYFIQRGSARTQAPPARPTVPVAVVPIIASNIELRVPATGNVQAWFDVDVSAQVSDNMRALYVDEGDVVTAGQALAQLDMREIDAMYDAAIAARISAEATIRQMSATLTNALRQYDRSSELLREKVIGQREHDDTELAVKLARGRYDMAYAEYNRLAALEEELAVRRERYTVRAPFDGVIAQCHLDQGSYVTPSVPVVRMTRISPIKVQVALPEAQAPLVKVGQPAAIRLWTLQDEQFTGTVTRLYPVLDERWRTQTVEIDCPNNSGHLRPGMFARAEIVTGRAMALLVPDVAVIKLSGSGITHIYTVDNNTARRIDVTVVAQLGAHDAVQGAVQAGQPVIVKGQLRVQTGTPVAVTQTEMLP